MLDSHDHIDTDNTLVQNAYVCMPRWWGNKIWTGNITGQISLKQKSDAFGHGLRYVSVTPMVLIESTMY